MPTHIQIGDTAPRAQYTANGTQTVFPYPFAIFLVSDLEVYLADALQSSGYAVSGAGADAGGNVTFAAAPASGAVVTLRRRLAIRRTTDFQDNGLFRAKVINDELDYQTAAIQQVADDVTLALKRSPTAIGTVDLTVPEPAAGCALKWNAAADGLVNSAGDADAVLTQAQAAATA
ncbi:MAG: hydrolase, partial [Alphaproteobacteria bacterium]|nr:hydrolase [Alphaproteobacteria bacterium]